MTDEELAEAMLDAALGIEKPRFVYAGPAVRQSAARVVKLIRRLSREGRI